MNVTVDDDSQSYAALRKHNYSDTAPRAQVKLGPVIMQYDNNATTHMKFQKHPIPGNEYPCFQTDIRSEQEEQCDKLISLTKFINNIISIELI